MLTLTGTVKNVLTTPEGTSKEGKSYGGKNQVQLEVKKALKNGDTKYDLLTLTIPEKGPFKEKIGKQINLPVGAFARGGEIFFYLQTPNSDA